jgi:hypothetical protein
LAPRVRGVHVSGQSSGMGEPRLTTLEVGNSYE